MIKQSPVAETMDRDTNGSTEVCREEASGGDVINGCFESVPQTERPKRSNGKKDGGRDTALLRRSVNRPFQGVLDERSGESWTINRSHSSSNVAAANTTLFAKWACLHEACHDNIATHLYQGSHPSSHPSCCTLPSQPPRVSTMQADCPSGLRGGK